MKVALFFECTEVDIQLQCKGYVKSVLGSLHQVGANLGGMQLFTAENSNLFKCVEVTMENILE